MVYRPSQETEGAIEKVHVSVHSAQKKLKKNNGTCLPGEVGGNRVQGMKDGDRAGVGRTRRMPRCGSAFRTTVWFTYSSNTSTLKMNQPVGNPKASPNDSR